VSNANATKSAPAESRKKLSLRRETVRHLSVKSELKTGMGGGTCGGTISCVTFLTRPPSAP
jgi:hypothetical protein